MFVKATEITSAQIPSDNPIHQRLLFAYEMAIEHVSGNLLELGCGEGRGLELLLEKTTSYTALEKNPLVIERLKQKYPDITIYQQEIPPFRNIADNTFDAVVTLQVVEHIEDDVKFVSEIHRVLKPGGVAVLSTPNVKMSLSRNPWHIREYTFTQFRDLLGQFFTNISTMGVYGDADVMAYYERNKASVARIKKLDILNLEQRLPRRLLAIPYEILNRRNRNRLMDAQDDLVMRIHTGSFHLAPASDSCFDLFYIVRK